MFLVGQLSIRAQRRLIFAASILCLGASVGLIAWAAWGNEQTGSKEAAIPSAPLRAAKLVSAPDPADFRPLLTRRLRRALVDPPPKPKPPAKKPKPAPARSPFRTAPRLDWRLVGTAMETEQQSAAFLVDSRGNIRVLRQGEPLPGLSGATVKRIRAKEVTIAYRGQDVVLRLPKPRETLQ